MINQRLHIFSDDWKVNQKIWYEVLSMSKNTIWCDIWAERDDQTTFACFKQDLKCKQYEADELSTSWASCCQQAEDWSRNVWKWERYQWTEHICLDWMNTEDSTRALRPACWSYETTACHQQSWYPYNTQEQHDDVHRFSCCGQSDTPLAAVCWGRCRRR